MKMIILAVGMVLYVVNVAAKELFKSVNYEKAYRLEEFNSEFLREQLHDSLRHRIIKVNSKVFDKDKSFTITPFEGMEPIVVTPVPDKTTRRGWATFWIGKIESNSSDATISFNLFEYDSDPNKILTYSMQNKFRHSEGWEIDDSGRPQLPIVKENENKMLGPPPESDEDIAHHRKMKKLKRKTVQALRGGFRVTDPNTGIDKSFAIVPLKFTPKYSVIYEIDASKWYPAIWHPEPGGPRERPALTGRYLELQLADKAMRDSLINEDHRPIMEDIE